MEFTELAYQHLKFEITPFAGLMLSESRPPTSDLKEFSYLKQVDVNPILSPALGVNITYHFITNNSINSNGPGTCWGINARAIYVPSAVRGSKIPYKGDICYFSLGVIFELFAVE